MRSPSSGFPRQVSPPRSGRARSGRAALPCGSAGRPRPRREGILDPAQRRAEAAASAAIWGPRHFVAIDIHKDYGATERLPEIGVPTLFTCGRHDVTRPEEAAWFRSLVPGDLVVFAQSSHMPHLEGPEHYLEVVRGFLRRADAR